MRKHCRGQVLNDGSLTSPCEAFAALHGGNSDDEATTDTNITKLYKTDTHTHTETACDNID